MKITILALLILVSTLGFGQSFSDCSASYYESYKKVEFDLMRYSITDKVGDSLRNVLDSEFQTCVIGKQIDYDGLLRTSDRDYNAENLNGKVVLLNFWSLSCGPCIVEIPFVNKLSASYKEVEDFVLVSILLDDKNKFDNFLQRGIIRERINFPVLSNNKDSVREKFKFVKRIPMNLFVDREGRIYMRTVGGIHNEESFNKIKSIIDSELMK